MDHENHCNCRVCIAMDLTSLQFPSLRFSALRSLAVRFRTGFGPVGLRLLHQALKAKSASPWRITIEPRKLTDVPLSDRELVKAQRQAIADESLADQVIRLRKSQPGLPVRAACGQIGRKHGKSLDTVHAAYRRHRSRISPTYVDPVSAAARNLHRHFPSPEIAELVDRIEAVEFADYPNANGASGRPPKCVKKSPSD